MTFHTESVILGWNLLSQALVEYLPYAPAYGFKSDV